MSINKVESIVTLGKGTPQRNEGKNGDITIRTSRGGLKMFVKQSNSWHNIDLDIDLKEIALSVKKLEAQIEKLLTRRNNSPVVDKLLLKQAGGTATVDIKNDAGNIALGTGSGNVTLESNGDYDLTLQTGNSATGSITILDGNNVDINIAPAGTGKVGISSDLNLATGKQFKINGTALAKGDVGLGNATNTADADKPISDDTATALALKATILNPVFTGNFELTSTATLTIDGSDDSAASLYIRGGVNDGEAALYIYPDKGGEAQDKFKIYATNGASAGHTSDGLRFAKMNASTGAWVDIMKMSYGGDAVLDSQVGIYAPVVSSSTLQAITITATSFIGSSIWKDFPFNTLSQTAARGYYYRDNDDSEDFRRWDEYDTDMVLAYRKIYGHYIVPENCTLTHMRGIIANNGATANPTINVWYCLKADIATDTGTTTFTKASPDETPTIGVLRIGYQFEEDYDVELTAGSIVIPTIKHTDLSSQSYLGSLTLKFITR